MGKVPESFKFSPSEWLMATDQLSDLAHRCYLRLLIFQWSRGHIPKTLTQRQRVCSVYDNPKWDVVWNEIAGKFSAIKISDICDYRGDHPDQIVFVNQELHEQREAVLSKRSRKEV